MKTTHKQRDATRRRLRREGAHQWRWLWGRRRACDAEDQQRLQQQLLADYGCGGVVLVE
ncbi:hypothetical protein Syun_013927 [Stephania yunnanensis]|uniref:Uncharacterized protein n=1 Tax=Stephania yunnanensis TaxID=152371 RepID=A0AAP0JKL8_9MAGN